MEETTPCSWIWCGCVWTLACSKELIIKSLIPFAQTWKQPLPTHSCFDFLLKKSVVNPSVVITEQLPDAVWVGTGMNLQGREDNEEMLVPKSSYPYGPSGDMHVTNT